MKKTVTLLLMLCLFLICLTGCQRENVSAKEKFTTTSAETTQGIELDDYLTSVKTQSDAIKASLEKDSLTQTEMNQKSQELRELWDAALSKVLDEAANLLNAEQAEQLTTEQIAWVESTSKAVETAGKEVEGGSMHALTVNMEATRLTEARVNAIYELLK